MATLNRLCEAGNWSRATAVRIMLAGQGLILAAGMLACASAGVL